MDDINTIPLEPRSDAGKATYWYKKWLEAMETNSNLLKRINYLEEQAAKYCMDDMFD